MTPYLLQLHPVRIRSTETLLVAGASTIIARSAIR